MKLVIIEGEGKRETIAKYLKKLGADYSVFATKGHIRDLPAKGLAVNVKNNFEPKYAIMDDKKAVVNQLLSQAKKADKIYLATDPDREGEAISWHLSNILEIPENEKCRVVFNEISSKAIEKAIKEPRELDLNLVDAQQARRILDRLVGYKLSPVLCKKIQNKLSAGRVQSVALRLVVDREREILAFVPEEFWTLTAFLLKGNAGFKSLLASFKGKKIKPSSKEEVDKILAALKGKEWIVSNVKKGLTKSHAPAPFITSTMQQDALNKLGMSLKATSSAAQSLYEGVTIDGEKTALVTYIRTDSTRISQDAMTEAAKFIAEKFGAKYVPEKPNFYKSKKSAQDAHEAIRPISLSITPDFVKNKLPKNEARLYKLIYDRFLASQMAEAEYDTVNVEIAAGDYTFKTNGKTLKFAGFTAAYGVVEDKGNTEQDSADGEAQEGLLPELNEGDKLSLSELKPEQKFTKPPARFTEASLVKAMEEKGIGRPATYTPTITTLFTRNYTEKEGKYLMPTQLGCSVTDMLLKYFDEIMDVGFTADMEDRLDEIEDGGKVWQDVVKSFYDGFAVKLQEAGEDEFTLKEPPQETEHKCEKCGSPMLIRAGRFGKFLACSGYPKCKNTKQLDEDGNIIEAKAAEKSGEVCPDCGSDLLVKQGKYGKFLGCSKYPECKYIKNLEQKAKPQEAGGVCPDCGKPLLKRMSRRNTEFYGCSGYPKCRFLSNFPVVEGKCPDCGGYLVEHTAKNETVVKCGNKDCGYAQSKSGN